MDIGSKAGRKCGIVSGLAKRNYKFDPHNDISLVLSPRLQYFAFDHTKSSQVIFLRYMFYSILLMCLNKDNEI
jgi:hypothetical protein